MNVSASAGPAGRAKDTSVAAVDVKPVKPDAVRGLISDVLGKVGLPAADAAKVADLMTETDLTGADSHGVFRLPHYVRRPRAGGINARAAIKVNRTAAATALVDGDNGMGHLVVSRAAETAIAQAREAGVAWVGVRNSNHAGAAGIYAAMALEHRMIGIYSAVASANHMPVWGGAENLLGTNPLAVAIPAREEAPIVLDMATTVISYGTVKSHKLAGRPLQEGWMVNLKDGRPLIDPERTDEGLLLPIGGYKGSGLAIILGLLGGPLNGALFGRDIVDFNADDTSACNTGQFVVALDIARFAPFDEFTAEVDRHLRDLRASKRLPGFDTIRLPGERRRRCKEERLRDGIPLPAALIAQLDRVADDLGVARLAERGGN
jgi:LDH2 family malate/lactate/ureidoglycolate dehydrogenase